MQSSVFLGFAAGVASGAAVGWITNAIAVNMLFRKYGRWGGVIEDRYEEFIENMAALVEADLLNHTTLHREFEGPEFKQALQSVIETMLLQELPAKSGDIRIADIPGIEPSAARLIALLREEEPEAIELLYRLFADKTVEYLVSKEQYYYLVDSYIPALCSDERRQEVKNLLHTFFADQPITAFIAQDPLNRLTENIRSCIAGLDLAQYDQDFDAAYTEVLSYIRIDQIIAGLEAALGRMRYADCIKDPAAVSQNVITQGIAFTESPEGQSILLETAAATLETAKQISLKITDAVHPGVKDGVVRFLNTNLPTVFDGIAVFINESSDEIEHIINAAVDRYLETAQDVVMLRGLKALFIGNIAKQFDVVEKIVQKVLTYGERAGEKCAKEAASFIETSTLGTIAALLQEQHILTPQKLVTSINAYLPVFLKKGETLEKVEKVLYSPIGNSFTPNLSMIQTVFLPNIFEQVKKQYLYQDRFKQDLQAKCIPWITELLTAPGSAFRIAETLITAVKAEPIQQSLRKEWDTIGAQTIGTMIPRETVKKLRIPWEGLWNRLKQRKLNQVYQALQNDNVYAKTADGVLRIINQHLDTLITGNIAKLVDTELRKASPAQIRVMVQNFIGKELKPINAFGALLGAIAGGIAAGAALVFRLPLEFNALMLLANGLIFTAVGIGTNWVAIKMLFRPYKKILFNVSPFIGITALRKPEFAKSIGNFIKEHTFNDASLSLFFSRNKKALQETAFSRIAASDYAAVDTFLSGQRLSRVTGFIWDYAVQHSAETAGAVEKAVQAGIASGNADEYLRRFCNRAVEKLRETDPSPYLYTYLVKSLNRKTIGPYLEKMSFAPLFERLSQELTLEQVEAFLYRQNDRFITYTSAHSFEDFAGAQTTAKLIQGLSEKISALLQEIPAIAVQYLKDTVCTPDTQLKNLFNRRLVKFIENHISSFLDLMVKDIAKQKGPLVQQIKDGLPWYGGPAKPHIAPIVDILIDEELPKFLKQKRTAILSIAESLLEYRLSDLGFNSDAIRAEAVEQGIADLLSSPQIQQRIAVFVQAVAERYTKAPLQSVLETLNIRDIKDLIPILEPLLGPAVSYIKSRLLDDPGGLGKNLLTKTVGGIEISELLAGIDFEQELRNSITALLQDTAVQAELSALLLRILSERAASGGLYDSEIGERDLRRFIAATTEQDGETLRAGAVPMLTRLFRELNRAVTAETKQAVCNDYLIPAALDTAEHRFTDIIGAIDIQKVAEQEINAMHPKEIETLFYKFAGTYFARIILYGWIGLFGGLLSYTVGCLLNLF